MKSTKIVSKKKPSPFVVLVVILLATTLLAYLFRGVLKRQTSPAHITELELNELTPEVRELVESSNSNFLKAKSLLQQTSETGLLDSDKKTVYSLIQDTTIKMNKAVNLDPENANLWSYRCRLYKDLILVEGALSLAIESCKKSIELDSSKDEVQFTLGGLFMNNKEYENAIDAFSKLTEKEPSNMNYYYNLGYAYALAGDKVNAKKSYKKAMELTEDESTKNKLQTEIDKL